MLNQKRNPGPVTTYGLTDEKVAREAANALAWSRFAQLHGVSLSVADGYVTLTGEVGYDFYRAVAESTVRYKPGVKGVINKIKVAMN